MSKPKNEPLISAVMSVFNGSQYLADCLDSVLKQTYSNFEFIIINDGSTDNTAEILDSYADKDSRLSIHHEKENLKLVRALNKGCKIARGKYIVRMDADDVCELHRFETQIRFLEDNPDIGILGSWVQNIDQKGNKLGIWQVPTDPSHIAWTLQFDCCMAQPSIMMRNDVLNKLDYYRISALQCEDYDLWCRASFVTKLANFPEALVQRRIWLDSRCFTNSDQVEEFQLKYMNETIAQVQNRKINPLVINCLRQTSLQKDCTPNLDLLFQAIDTIDRSFNIYRIKNLSKLSLRKIKNDTGNRLYYLAKCIRKQSYWKAFPIKIRSFLYYPRYIFRQLIRDTIIYQLIKPIKPKTSSTE
jgi:glycosyltransferase involved in cell wall biosynthesis